MNETRGDQAFSDAEAGRTNAPRCPWCGDWPWAAKTTATSYKCRQCLSRWPRVESTAAPQPPATMTNPELAAALGVVAEYLIGGRNWEVSVLTEAAARVRDAARAEHFEGVIGERIALWDAHGPAPLASPYSHVTVEGELRTVLRLVAERVRDVDPAPIPPEAEREFLRAMHDAWGTDAPPAPVCEAERGGIDGEAEDTAEPVVDAEVRMETPARSAKHGTVQADWRREVCALLGLPFSTPEDAATQRMAELVMRCEEVRALRARAEAAEHDARAWEQEAREGRSVLAHHKQRAEAAERERDATQGGSTKWRIAYERVVDQLAHTERARVEAEEREQRLLHAGNLLANGAYRLAERTPFDECMRGGLLQWDATVEQHRAAREDATGPTS